MKKSSDEFLKSVNSEQTGEESDSIDEEKEDFVSDSAPVPDEIFAILDAMLEEFGLEGKAETVKFSEPIAALLACDNHITVSEEGYLKTLINKLS